MIRVGLNDSSFSYDVHSLTKAFYPVEDVKICSPDEADRFRVFSEPGRICVEIGENSREIPVPPETPRAEVKNLLKRTLYDALCEENGHSLPWGTLSGIRPVKVPMRKMMQGASAEEARAYFQNTYLADDSRTDLALGIASRELDVLNGKEPLSSGKTAEGGAQAILDGYSLYISTPFCPSICLYCSFPSGTIGTYRKQVEPYLDALIKELQAVAEMMEGRKLYSVYIGGGTPTALSPDQLGRVMDAAAEYFDFSALMEYTVEAGRPDTITEEHLVNMRGHGVNRVSVNPQTMHQRTLDLIGRRHTVEETENAFSLARSAGFDDINMDLIIGLPGESEEDILETLRRMRDMDPDALTVHSLAVKRSSRLHEKLEEYGGLFHGITRGTMDRIIAAEAEAGLSPYYLYRQKNIAGNLENIGFAKYGKAGLYNILMMEELHTVMACGAGAISKIVYPGGERIERAANVSDILHYLGRTEEMIERKKKALEDCRAFSESGEGAFTQELSASKGTEP